MKLVRKQISVLLMALILTLSSVSTLARKASAREAAQPAPYSLSVDTTRDNSIHHGAEGTVTEQFTAAGILVIGSACFLLLSNRKKWA